MEKFSSKLSRFSAIQASHHLHRRTNKENHTQTWGESLIIQMVRTLSPSSPLLRKLVVQGSAVLVDNVLNQTGAGFELIDLAKHFSEFRWRQFGNSKEEKLDYIVHHEPVLHVHWFVEWEHASSAGPMIKGTTLDFNLSKSVIEILYGSVKRQGNANFFIPLTPPKLRIRTV